MTNLRQVVRGVAEHIADTANRTVKECLKDGWVEQEPPLTDRFIGAVVKSMHGYETKGIKWNAKTLSDRGQKSQESKFGADFVGILDINLPEFKIRKGFLAQAKLLKGGNMNAADFKDMVEQCDKMLGISSESFVFFYSTKGISIVHANSIIGVRSHRGSFDPSILDDRDARTFYEAHLECHVGDRRINAPSAELLGQLKARTGMELTAKMSGKE